MKIFLTGGTGFIGSHFINAAHADGHEIVALRRSLDSSPRVPLSREPLWVSKTFEEIEPGDFHGCEAVVHLAAHSANVPYDSLENCIIQNVIAPLKLFRAAITAGIRRYIVAGSCFEYGRSGERYEYIPTDAPLEPASSYPASKAAASVAFHALACEENLELLILRIFQVYGKGESASRFWPSLRKAAIAGTDFRMSAGKQVRDFINVADVAASFLSATSGKSLKPGEPVIENLGSGHPRSLAQFALDEWKRFDAKGNLILGDVAMRQDEVMRLTPQISKPYGKSHHPDTDEEPS